MGSMSISPNNSIEHEFDQMLSVLHDYIRAEDIRIALDVGSRDALAALAMCRNFRNAKVYAFECNPPAIELCRRNAASEPRITVIDRAVSHLDGELTFYAIDPKKTITPHSDGNIGASSLFLARRDYPFERYVQNPIKVMGVTLESWARERQIEEIDLLWMDLQGAELSALTGLGQLISGVKFVYTEVEYQPMYVDQPLAADIYKALGAAGFVEVSVLYSDEWMGNVLFRRRDLCELTLAGHFRSMRRSVWNYLMKKCRSLR